MKKPRQRFYPFDFYLSLISIFRFHQRRSIILLSLTSNYRLQPASPAYTALSLAPPPRLHHRRSIILLSPTSNYRL
jgi:hypothetical protein